LGPLLRVECGVCRFVMFATDFGLPISATFFEMPAYSFM
jgi:hypothetical protein